MACVRGRVIGAAAGLVVGAAVSLAACGGTPTGQTDPTPGALPARADREQLAGLAAAAKDRRYVATYTLSAPKQDDRVVTVAVATDGSWVVAIPAGALGGLADIAIFGSHAGMFQCALGPAMGTVGVRPDLPPVTAGCVKVSRLTAATDPRIHHMFTDWIDPLTDRAAALSVTAVRPLAGAQGSCYSVESNSAALAPPVDPGIYCYKRDGLLSAARVGFGTLTLAGAVAPAPPSVAMPAPVVSRPPLPLVAPAPPPSPSASASPKPII
jgi:hypothetical protein